MIRRIAQKVGLTAVFLFLAAVLALPLPSHAQGCSMCRDTAAGSAPQVRKSLRLAIPVLGIPAAALFVAMLVVGFRFRAKTDA